MEFGICGSYYSGFFICEKKAPQYFISFGFSFLATRKEGYTAMDLSCDGSILAVATEKNEEEVKIFLEFW